MIALVYAALIALNHHALSDAQLSQDCALPGGYASGGYHQGWTTILNCLTVAVEASDADAGRHP